MLIAVLLGLGPRRQDGVAKYVPAAGALGTTLQKGERRPAQYWPASVRAHPQRGDVTVLQLLAGRPASPPQ